MAKLQAKTEKERLHIANILGFAAPIDENGVSSLCYVEFDTLAEIVDYLRGDECLIKVELQDILSKISEYMEVQQKIEDYARLLEENRKLNNGYLRLLEENKQLKEKTKNLPRIATLNKRIHELKQELKKYG